MAILETQLNKLRIRDAEAQHANDGLKKDINDLRKKRMVINSSHARVRRGGCGRIMIIHIYVYRRQSTYTRKPSATFRLFHV